MIHNVLIIEDEPEVARIIAQYIVSRSPSHRDDRYQVVGTGNTLAAARALVNAVKIDLILLDVYLPDGTGLDLLAELRANGVQCEAMLCTAAKEVPVLERGMQLGVCDFLVKPLMLSRLDQALSRYENRVRQFASARELTQTVADALFSHPDDAANAIRNRLPKGVDSHTLDMVRKLYQQQPTLIATAQSIGEQLGISRSTARRYLEYLAGTGQLTAEQKYGTVGRPERCYRAPVNIET